MGQNSSMGQFTGVSLKLLLPRKIIFNDIDDSDWPRTVRSGHVWQVEETDPRPTDIAI